MSEINEINVLKKKRTAIKGRITKKEKFFTTLNDDFADIEKLQINRTQFDNLIAEFYEIQDALIEKCHENEVDALTEESSSMDEKSENVSLIYARVMRKLGVPIYNEHQPNADGDMDADDRKSASTIQNRPSIRLPEIALPTFTGKYDEWLDFRQQFECLVKNDNRIAENMKMLYLRNCLKGDAKNVQCNEDTFESLWNALILTYENKRYIINKHITDFMAMKIMSRSSGQDLRDIINNARKHVRAFSSFEFEMNPLNEMILIYIVSEKLDYAIRNDYELSLEPNELPTWSKFMQYLEKRCNTLESIDISKKAKQTTKNEAVSKKQSNPSSKVFANTVSNSNDNKNNSVNNSNDKTKKIKCYFCAKEHYMSKCEEFGKLKYDDKWAKVREYNLCPNCLNKGHNADSCSRPHCSVCSEKHNKLLHKDKFPNSSHNKNSNENQSNGHNSNDKNSNNNFVGAISNGNEYALLQTAIIYVRDNFGNRQIGRCLLDSAAMSSVISESFARKLGLKPNRVSTSIGGVNYSNCPVDRKLCVQIESRTTDYSRKVVCSVIPHITSKLPTFAFNCNLGCLPKNVVLADEKFNDPRELDMILGVELHYEVHNDRNSVIEIEKNLYAENTVFGYVLSGMVDSANVLSNSFNGFISNDDLHQQMKLFWEYDRVNDKKTFTPEEKVVEKHFENTYYRYPDGRFGVYLPFKSNVANLGDSKERAIKCFLSLEKRLDKDPELKMEYSNFIKEYLNLNHLELYEDDVNDVASTGHYFMPHHAVIKPTSSTTKLRVVFNGSALTTNGLSLNTVTYKGPVVQSDYLNILMRFRFLRYVFSCDCAKMYRQVRVHSSQRQFQLIVWRDNSSESIHVFKLCTVTYGTNCAAYLSTRSLNQLAIDERKFPLASSCVLRDFYVDDCLSGSDTLEGAMELKRQLISLLSLGQFELHKWCANSLDLLNDIPDSKREIKKDMIEESSVKALGITWEPLRDLFVFSINKEMFGNGSISKRSVLSDIARYYDPLGLTEPLKLTSKVFMQNLWQKNYDWDCVLDSEDSKFWNEFRNELLSLKPIFVRRFVLNDNVVGKFEIHGFSDASQNGYGACVYVRSVDEFGDVKTFLLCAKSRVSPLVSHTIPRLELLGANLLAKLLATVKESIPSDLKYEIFLWTDSMVVLSWIRMMSRSLKTFVSHKVAEIQEMTNIRDWRFVPTNFNPADILSRGLLPSQIHDCEIWWKGPGFLLQNREAWPVQNSDIKIEEVPEIKTGNFAVFEIDTCELITKFSSYRKMIKVTAVVLRFVNNIRNKINKNPIHKGSISIREMSEANYKLINLVQREVYGKDFYDLSRKKNLNNNSKLLMFAPFIDERSVLRMGGRLSKSLLPFNEKHPVILPHNHHFTDLLIRCYHEENLHAGKQFVLGFLRRKYWITHARSAVRKIVRACVKCFKMKPSLVEQYMADLPSVRVQPALPFQKTGVDFCGPFWIKANPRGTVKTKGYVCVYQCMVTRAIHLDLASDMSSNCFLNCLHRFIGRRGMISDMYSDNGTNFKGANNKMHELFLMFESQQSKRKIENWCGLKQINWHFNPPSSPHMGGTWESAVKLTKTLLVKFLSDAYLTYEEFYTVLCRVESVLNSRPLINMTDDENDLNVLTPGHFLIGRPLNELLEPDLTELPMNRLDRYQYLVRLKQDFWRVWVRDYLNQLQVRFKWHKKLKVAVGQLVIVKEDNVPSFSWVLGRVLKLHPGSDDVVRVVTLKTKNGELVRPLAKLCFLPTKDNFDLVNDTNEIKEN